METSLKRSHACTATLSAPNPAAGHHRPTPLLETPGHPQASPGQSLVGSLLLSPGSFPVVQAGFRKGRRTRDQIASICWIKKAREFEKNIYFCFIDYTTAYDCVDHNKLWKILKDRNTRPPDLPLEKPVCKVRKQELELDMEQQTGSKSGKEYVKAVYCHPAYLIYMQSTS